MKVAALQMAMRLQGGASAELCANTGRCSREENRAGGGVGGVGRPRPRLQTQHRLGSGLDHDLVHLIDFDRAVLQLDGDNGRTLGRRNGESVYLFSGPIVNWLQTTSI